MILTDEQKKVIENFTELKNGERIKVDARAGTGKTQTMLELIRRNPNEKFYYFAFNRAIMKEVSRKVLEQGIKNVRVWTFHKFAYQRLPKNLRGKVRSWKAIDVEKILEDKLNRFKELKPHIAYIVWLALKNNFRLSRILKEIVKRKYGIDFPLKKLLQELIRRQIAKGDIDFETMLYLINVKLHEQSLATYKGRKIRNVNIIVDEAQDVNQGQFALAKKLARDKKLIAVGDRHQAIYGWRGAENQMLDDANAKTLYLTHSFRFPSSSAQEILSNALLNKLKGDDVPIVGVGDGKPKDGSIAIITRTNTSIILLAQKATYKFRLLRPIDEILRLHKDIYLYFIKADKTAIIHNLWIKLFNSLQDLYNYAVSVGDEETISAILWINKYDSPLKVAKEIKSREADKDDKDAVVFTTAHTAKGLEWDKVIIYDDFPDLFQLIAEDGCPNVECALKKYMKHKYLRSFEEINLLYVAITRARVSIEDYPEQLTDILRMSRFEIDKAIEAEYKTIKSVKSGEKVKESRV